MARDGPSRCATLPAYPPTHGQPAYLASPSSFLPLAPAGALRSADEQHASFRRAMEAPSFERKRPAAGRSSGKRGDGPAGPSSDRRGQPPSAAAVGSAAPAERDSGDGPAGTGGGVLESRDELHSSFHRAMEEAAAAEQAAQATRRYTAAASSKRRPGGASPAPSQPAQPSPAASAAAASTASEGGSQVGRSESVLASLRKKQEDASSAQRSLAGLSARAKGGRCGTFCSLGWEVGASRRAGRVAGMQSVGGCWRLPWSPKQL